MYLENAQSYLQSVKDGNFKLQLETDAMEKEIRSLMTNNQFLADQNNPFLKARTRSTDNLSSQSDYRMRENYKRDQTIV